MRIQATTVKPNNAESEDVSYTDKTKINYTPTPKLFAFKSSMVNVYKKRSPK